MSNENISLPIQQLEAKFRSILPSLPKIAGNQVVNFALENFKRQGFLGDSFQPWRKRKNPTKWGKTPPRNNRATLVDTGTLRRSIRIVRHNFDEVVIGSDVSYAKAHNDGVRLGIIQQIKPFTRKTISKKVGIIKNTSLKTKSNITFGKYQTGEHTVKAHKRRINQNIPARKFLGQSQYLTAAIKRTITAELMKAFR